MDYETLRTVCSIAGLLLFVAIFLIVLFWTYRPGSRETYQKMANIVLREEN